MTGAVTKFPAVDPDLRRRLTRASRAAVHNTQERDRLIADAYRSGSSMREIGRLVGMTHPGVRSILIRDGAYDPTRGDNEIPDNNVPREHS